MNAVVLAVVLMLLLSLARVHVMLAMMLAAFVGGWVGGLEVTSTLDAFNKGIGGGASIALSYALLGAFAVAISLSGLPQRLVQRILHKVPDDSTVYSADTRWLKGTLLLILTGVAIASQNIVPIHIAFIPILIPPLLAVTNALQIDRRVLASVLTFGLITAYLFIPVGFGNIYLQQILLGRSEQAGLDITGISVVKAMSLPALGMLVGLFIAIFISYRRPRTYSQHRTATLKPNNKYDTRGVIVAIIAVVVALIVQLSSGSMMLGAMMGFVVFSLTGVVRWQESEGVVLDGIKMMASIGFIMIAAAGFAEVLKQTGHIELLINQSGDWLGAHRGLSIFLLLLLGLLLTMGIGSSFSTIPILATLYVPLGLAMGLTPLAIITLIGTAGALGDAGSPASDSTLGPTAGLNADGQHHHIWDTVVPTFLHFNLPLLVFGWLAVMIL